MQHIPTSTWAKEAPSIGSTRRHPATTGKKRPRRRGAAAPTGDTATAALGGSRERIDHKQSNADSLTGVGSPSRNNIQPTRNQEEGPPSRTAPTAAAVAGTKTGRKKGRSQEVASRVQPISWEPVVEVTNAGATKVHQKPQRYQLQHPKPGQVRKNSRLGKAAATAGATPSLGHSTGAISSLRTQIMMAMVSEASRLAPPIDVEMRQIPKSSEQYLRRGSRRTRNPSAHYDDNSVPYLEPTRHTPELRYLRVLKKATTWALAPPFSVQMQAKVSLQVPSPTQRTRTPPLRAVYFGEGRKLISTKGYASALK